MICSCGNLALASSSDHVARAVLIRAQKRTPAVDLFLFGRFRGIEGSFRAFRIARHSANLGELSVVVRAIPVGGPLPNVPGHVIKPVTIGQEVADGGDANETVSAGILNGEMP